MTLVLNTDAVQSCSCYLVVFKLVLQTIDEQILFEICITNLLAGEAIIPFASSNFETIVTEADCCSECILALTTCHARLVMTLKQLRGCKTVMQAPKSGAAPYGKKGEILGNKARCEARAT